MIYIRPGSQAFELLTLLAVVGEFPTCSVHLLGNERVHKALVSKLSDKQEFCHTDTGQVHSTKLLTVSGKGATKTIRLYRKALPILEWIELDGYYSEAFSSHKFSGSAYHVSRNHRVAEAVVMMMKAGLEIRPHKLIPIQSERRMKLIEPPAFYSARALKGCVNEEMSKTIFTRIVGALFVDRGCYAIYNTRGAVMRWSGKGEFKAREALSDIGRMNAGIDRVDSAILFGNNVRTAFETLTATDHNRRKDIRFDGIYSHIHFIPLNQMGIRQLRLFTIPRWQDRILQLLFEDHERTYNNGQFEYDATVDGTHVFVHFDGDLARLIRYRDGSQYFKVPHEVLCFPHQVEYVRSYLSNEVKIKTIDIDVIEDALGIGKEKNEE